MLSIFLLSGWSPQVKQDCSVNFMKLLTNNMINLGYRSLVTGRGAHKFLLIYLSIMVITKLQVMLGFPRTCCSNHCLTHWLHSPIFLAASTSVKCWETAPRWTYLPKYQEYKEVFSKVKASILPSHLSSSHLHHWGCHGCVSCDQSQQL